jgi:hypothetical protein
MALEEELLLAGFSVQQAQKLAAEPYFIRSHPNQSAAQFAARMDAIASVYSATPEQIRKAVVRFPVFIDLNHLRVADSLKAIYKSWKKVGKAVLSHPSFAGLDHKRVISDITKLYGYAEEDAKKIVLSHPPFAGRNHERLAGVLKATYGDMAAVSRAVFKCPSFATLDHARLISDLTAIYGSEADVKKILLKYPTFATRNHPRVIRDAAAVYGSEETVKKMIITQPTFVCRNPFRTMAGLKSLGTRIGLGGDEVRGLIIKNPVLSSYSIRRYRAMFQVGVVLKKEGFEPDREMLRIMLRLVSKSPYVPNTPKLGIFQARKMGIHQEPQLLKEARKALARRLAT